MKRITILLSAFAASAMLSACETTQEVNQTLQMTWIGQPAELFFARHGAPMQQFALQSGGVNYTWRGGQTTVTIPAQYRPAPQAQKPNPVSSGFGSRSTSTTTTVSNPAPGTTVTRTETRSSGVSFNPEAALAAFGGQPQTPPGQVLVRPAQTRQLFCEATITTDAEGRITAFNILRDTTGEGFSLSRCNEVLRGA
ncbi:MAG: hypothetical protein CMJ42_22645 [Phyllobacteriaceae bacterium]|nr:hypothetical protein [Phyllobacteriaceae bacterium]MBA91943.1 hypothetical protein [Phyllobacteriaceae bacterium]